MYQELRYRTIESCSKTRRVVAKSEVLPGKENPRLIVTSLSSEYSGAAKLYEQHYCARGEMENRIKEQQLGLFADRTSTHTMRANQLRILSRHIQTVCHPTINNPSACEKCGLESAASKVDKGHGMWNGDGVTCCIVGEVTYVRTDTSAWQKMNLKSLCRYSIL